jgi:hypothetical protein
MCVQANSRAASLNIAWRGAKWEKKIGNPQNWPECRSSGTIYKKKLL